MAGELNDFVTEAAKHIKNSGKTATPPAAFASMAGVSGGNADFCELWPGIKTALELLDNFLPAWARWMVTALISIGDKVCK